MKFYKILIFIILFSLIEESKANCFYTEILQHIEIIKYPTIAYENEIESEIHFRISDKKIMLDSSKELKYSNLFDKVIKNISNINSHWKCNDIPKIFIVKFEITNKDTFFIEGNKLSIQRKDWKSYLNNAKESSEYFKNSKMKYKQNEWELDIDIRKGKKTVFKYQFEKEENPFISDDEYIEGIIFQIPSNTTEFEYKDHELSKIKLYHETICFGSCSGKFLSNGYVKGKLINGIWEIEMNIVEKLIKRKFKKS